MLSGTGSFIAFSYSVLFYSDFLGGREGQWGRGGRTVVVKSLEFKSQLCPSQV